MNRWRVILAAAVIFLAGAGTGAIVARNYAPKVVKRTHISPPLPTTPERRVEYIDKLDRAVGLTPEQRTQVEGILAASQKRMKMLWEPLEPQVKEEYRRSRREIMEILNPEQQERMKQWRKDKENKDGTKETNKYPSRVESQKRCSKPYCCL